MELKSLSARNLELLCQSVKQSSRRRLTTQSGYSHSEKADVQTFPEI
jgi:hypothetical protein